MHDSLFMVKECSVWLFLLFPKYLSLSFDKLLWYMEDGINLKYLLSASFFLYSENYQSYTIGPFLWIWSTTTNSDLKSHLFIHSVGWLWGKMSIRCPDVLMARTGLCLCSGYSQYQPQHTQRLTLRLWLHTRKSPVCGLQAINSWINLVPHLWMGKKKSSWF